MRIYFVFIALQAAVSLALTHAHSAAPAAVSFSGQVRARVESTNLDSYSTSARQRALDTALLRVRLGAAVDGGAGVKAFVQLQDSRNWGSEASVAANSANVDLHQGYLDVLDLFGRALDLRVGRMELQYGDQRLISPLDWNNVGRAWDGARLRWRAGNHSLDVFETVVKEVNSARRHGHFWGLYASCKPLPAHELDAYVLGRDQGDGTLTNEHGSRGNLSDRTLGGRLKAAAGRVEYAWEGAWQFGRKAGQQARAWAMATALNYAFTHALKPRAGVEYDFASGDSNPFDNKVQTFDPLYPFGHFYQGHQDVFAWKNGHDFKALISIDPKADWRIQADFHHFRLHHGFDSWYDATGTQIARQTSGAAGKDIGNELDLHIKGKFRESISLWMGYSRFFAGSFARTTTGRGDRDWGFLQATFNF